MTHLSETCDRLSVTTVPLGFGGANPGTSIKRGRG
jgi:hypothetical protein